MGLPARDQRVAIILRKADLFLPEKIPTLAKIPPLDFESSLVEYSKAARSLLAEQRKADPGYRRPETQKRHLFRTKSRKKLLCNEEEWTFTKYEVARAFDDLLSYEPLAKPGVAQALLSHTSITSLDELWSHLHESKWDKSTSSRYELSKISLTSETPWLDKVTGQGNVEYIRLMCQAGLGQEALDRAFSVALSKHWMDAMEVLLEFGATASHCKDTIRERVRLEDAALTWLLLSAPNAMSAEDWRHCMQPEVERVPTDGERPCTILLLCLAHRPDVVSGTLLLKAIESQNLKAMAIILAYAEDNANFRDIHQSACELACCVQDDQCRYKMFAILAESGFLVDAPIIRQELLKAVQSRQLLLVQVLADSLVSLDIEPYNAVSFAVEHMYFDVLELFRNGAFSLPVSNALKYVPSSASEAQILRLLDILASRGLIGEELDLHLVRAVRQRHHQLIDKLLLCGASIEYKQALAVQIALSMADFDILAVLLSYNCRPEILSLAIPTAMALQPRASRRQALKALILKGVLSQWLGILLQRLVAEDGDVDLELIQSLLRHEAPIDGVGTEADNAVIAAVKRGNPAVLQMLCDTGPRNVTLCKAVAIAFGAKDVCGYEVAIDMIKILLQKGAAGLAIHQTLLDAAETDDRLDIVRLLVAYGAEANYATGASFVVALKKGSIELLEILCKACPLSEESMKSVLSMAIDPLYYKLEALELLLGSSPLGARTLDASWAFEKFRVNSNATTIIPCFLRHGLDVDHGDGVLLRFAIARKDTILLRGTLSANPSIISLTAAFQTATSLQPRNIELELMRLLLDKAKSVEIGQSKSLLHQTHIALAGDLEGLRLLLRHKAVVDFDDGAAVQAAAAAGDLQVLDLLLLSGPAPSTISRACLATAESFTINLDLQQAVFDHLLSTRGGLSAEDMSQLLAESVVSFPECIQLPQLLLARHVKVKTETLKISMEKSSSKLFEALVTSIEDDNTVVSLFRHARKVSIDPERRYWVYQYILSRGISIPSDDVSEALLNSLNPGEFNDLTFPKLLLSHGATASYKNGAAFSLALRSNSIQAVRLLSQYLDNNTANVVFDLAWKTSELAPEVRLGVYRCLLQWNVDKTVLHHALVHILEGDSPEIAIVQLLLEKGADPNAEDARCFVLASKTQIESVFRLLSKYAEPEIVLKALMSHFQREVQVVRWFNICLREQPRHVRIGRDELLFQCMRKFPKATSLLKLLFDLGVSPSAMINHRLCASWEPEPCTALVWALFSKPRIENDSIFILLKQGDAALPTYSTPRSKVSAAFGCLLDKTRHNIFKALLDVHGVGISNSMIPGASLGCLGAYPKVSKDELGLLPDELSLQLASLYLGNFKAFRLLRGGETPNDGTLQLAALMALPQFVKWLLETHDPNCKLEEFDKMIPLALVCSSTPQPWCKIANKEEDSWKTRQRVTMEILARRTSPKWNYRGKTVLHIAIEKGLAITKAMVKALDIRIDREKDEKYLYKDKDGIEYSPQQYILKIMELGEQERKALIKCITDCGMKSRYFKRILPADGQQPLGYHGLPPDLAAAWEAHERG